MTVSTELSHEEYIGNGVTTDFDFRFRIFEAKHLVVSVADPDGTERILTNGTDYTLRGVGSYRGGKVILKMPLATGWKIGIARDLPAVQETDLRNQGKFFAEVHEGAFDYLTMLIQKSLGYLSLCLRKPSFISDHYDAKGNKIANLGKPVKSGDAVDLGTMKEHISAKDKRSLRVADKDIPALPNAANRANKLLSFDNNGDPVVVVPESGSAADVLTELRKPSGSGLIGHGDTIVGEKLGQIDTEFNEFSLNAGFNKIGRFLNINKLREHKPVNIGMIVYVASAYSETDDEHHHGGGHFQSFDNSSSPIEDDGGIVIVPASGNIAWRRINFTAYDMCFWGVKPDGKTDNAEAITRATGYAKNKHVILQAPAGDIHTSEMVPVYSRTGIVGAGYIESTVFYKTTNNQFSYMNGEVVAEKVDALVGFVPDKHDILGSGMDTYCNRPVLEKCMFRRLGLNASNVKTIRPQYGLFMCKADHPVVKQVSLEGGYIGIKAYSTFSGVMEQVFANQFDSEGFIGFDCSRYAGGVLHTSGTSMDLRLVQVKGYQIGFGISRLQYSTMIDCSAEVIMPMINETEAWAFDFRDPYCISMISCATEFVKGGQIRVSGFASPSYKPAIKISGYLPIDQQNPNLSTPMFLIDGDGYNPMNILFDTSDISRKTSLTNLTKPVVSGVDTKVIIIGCSGDDWLVKNGGVFNRIA